jgi:CRP-like cAMP-binding protein
MHPSFALIGGARQPLYSSTPNHAMSSSAPASHDTPSTPAAPRNRLLEALPDALLDELLPALEPVMIDVRQPVASPGQPYEYVWFPESCIVSVVNDMRDGSTVETGTIGNEGVAGLPALMDAVSSETRMFCQVPGRAQRAPAPVVVDLVERERELRRLVNRYAQAYLTQVAQGAACNRLHGIEQRCARWLLLTHDRVAGDEFPLKQQFLAEMLGVRRAGVSVAASALQQAALIRYSRGTVQVLDRAGLEAASCECYGVIREQFDRLLPGRMS